MVMYGLSRVSRLLLCFSLPAFAKQSAVPPPNRERPSSAASSALHSANQHITLDVVVTGKSGKPVAGLQASDFTILDNKQPQRILSFQAVDGTHPAKGTAAAAGVHPQILLLRDEVHLFFPGVALGREQIARFLRTTGASSPMVAEAESP
jgi:hypothetical protein